MRKTKKEWETFVAVNMNNENLASPELLKEFAEFIVRQLRIPPKAKEHYYKNTFPKRITETAQKENFVPVYFITQQFVPFGLCTTIIAISPYIGDWYSMWQSYVEKQKDMRFFCYVINHDKPECSEFGICEFKQTEFDDIVRIL